MQEMYWETCLGGGGAGEPSHCDVSLTPMKREEKREGWVGGILDCAADLIEFWLG